MEDCIFCKIINGKIPSDKVYEDDKVLVFKDIEPHAPVHILLIPKKHIESLNDLDENDGEIISHIFMVVKLMAKKFNVAEKGYRVVTNCGTDGGQSVNHVHFHMLAGRNLQWPPG